MRVCPITERTWEVRGSGMRLRTRTVSLLEEPSSFWRRGVRQSVGLNALLPQRPALWKPSLFVSWEVKDGDSLSGGSGVSLFRSYYAPLQQVTVFCVGCLWSLCEYNNTRIFSNLIRTPFKVSEG
jgi:hypothetical protein